MIIKVAGVTFPNSDGSSRQRIIEEDVEIGDEIVLEKEPDNKFDENAIKILTKNGKQLGYVPKDVAKDLKDEDVNFIEAEVANKLGGDRVSWGLRINLQIFDEKTEGLEQEIMDFFDW